MAKKPRPLGPNKGSLARNRATCEPFTKFYIYAEGSVTEPEYIKSFYNSLCGKKKILLDSIKGGSGVPLSIVSECVKKKGELRKSSKRNSYEKNFVLWAVFDVDIHPKIDEAINLANAHDIRCIISNPCIEVWGLMHKSMYERPSTRHEAQAELVKAMPGYHHEKSPIFPWEECKKSVVLAKNNSIASLRRRVDDGVAFPKGNPSTNFHELLIELKGGEWE